MTDFSPDWRDTIGGAIETIPVAERPCDECGITGQSRLYVDMHVFCLCPACAWKLTDEYHANDWPVPWEGSS